MVSFGDVFAIWGVFLLLDIAPALGMGEVSTWEREFGNFIAQEMLACEVRPCSQPLPSSLHWETHVTCTVGNNSTTIALYA